MSRRVHSFALPFEAELDVSYTFQPGDPGCISGPPERCWPPEPDEIEVVSVTLNGHDITAMLTPAQLAEIADGIEHDDDDLTEPDTDWRADEARERIAFGDW